MAQKQLPDYPESDIRLRDVIMMLLVALIMVPIISTWFRICDWFRNRKWDL